MNRSKQVGTEWETRLIRFFDSYQIDARRQPPAGANDRGDIHLWLPGRDTPYVIEAKATRALDLAAGMNELKAEIAHAGGWGGACVFKRRSHDTGRAYVVQELGGFCSLIAEEPF